MVVSVCVLYALDENYLAVVARVSTPELPEKPAAEVTASSTSRELFISEPSHHVPDKKKTQYDNSGVLENVPNSDVTRHFSDMRKGRSRFSTQYDPSLPLKTRITHALTHCSSTVYNETDNLMFSPVTFVCRNDVTAPPHRLTLFTTISNDREKFSVFKTTIELWSRLSPSIKFVLFVAPNTSSKLERNTARLVHEACSRGWDVAIAPSVNHENYPLLRSMFLASYELYDSRWHGYANADILFDQSLLAALSTLEEYADVTERYSLIVGRRHDVNVIIMS